jgi:hypothetical protein
MFKQREEASMRRKIMTAFVCAIMTISVIPVYADDTQTDQAVTTEVSTETAATVQETKRTQSKQSHSNANTSDQ